MPNTHLRNLSVPFFSQRKNDYILKDYYTSDVYDDKTNKLLHKEGDLKREISMDCRSCNISSVMMIMEYFGFTGVERTVGDKTFTTPKTPKEFLVRYFNREFDSLFTNTKKPTYGVACLEDWYNLERIATDIFGAECTYYGNNTENINLKNVKDEIAAGYPVCISIGMEKKTDGTYKREGHVVVVRGFTKIGTTEYIILNDPWGAITDDEFNVYEISDKTSLGSYYYGRDKDSKTGGDNVIVRLSDFKGKLVKGTPNGADTATYFHNVMTIHAPLWNFPDGSIDFSAASVTKVKSFIYGKIVAKGWISTDGRCLLIQRASNNYLYLLCHLNSYPADIAVGKEISPGDIIAYTGTSGATAKKCSEDTFKNAPHLHVSVIKYDKIFVFDECLTDSEKVGTKESTYNWLSSFKKIYVDPFDYTIEWKGMQSIPGKE